MTCPQRDLQALHSAGVVFRELAPARVLISDQDGRAVLTDFKLAKLLDGSPSLGLNGAFQEVYCEVDALLIVTLVKGRIADCGVFKQTEICVATRYDDAI